MWKPYFRELFLGYRNVNILADGDEPGLEFAKAGGQAALPNARIIPMPDGEDVNSLVNTQGKSRSAGKDLMRTMFAPITIYTQPGCGSPLLPGAGEARRGRYRLRRSRHHQERGGVHLRHQRA